MVAPDPLYSARLHYLIFGWPFKSPVAFYLPRFFLLFVFPQLDFVFKIKKIHAHVTVHSYPKSDCAAPSTTSAGPPWNPSIENSHASLPPKSPRKFSKQEAMQKV